jgi:NADH-quinone oxidoreductase subunit J
MTATVIFGILTVFASLGVVFGKKPLTSALWLVVTFFLLSVHYAILGADFLAALQILIYAGAIMVLVVFVIMLLGLNTSSDLSKNKVRSGLLALLALCFIGILVKTVVSIGGSSTGLSETASAAAGGFTGDPKAIGLVLIEKYLFPFQLAALLLLAAIIGAVTLAYEPPRPLQAGRGLAAMQKKHAEKDTK